MINTYKESSLHRTLKELYAAKTVGKTEVEADGHIYDILTDKGEVIEIQTQNLAKLKKSGALLRIGPDKGGHWLVKK